MGWKPPPYKIVCDFTAEPQHHHEKRCFLINKLIDCTYALWQCKFNSPFINHHFWNYKFIVFIIAIIVMQSNFSLTITNLLFELIRIIANNNVKLDSFHWLEAYNTTQSNANALHTVFQCFNINESLIYWVWNVGFSCHIIIWTPKKYPQ